MAATTEDQATIGMAVTVVPAYDPANPYSVLDTIYTGYDQYLLTANPGPVIVPARGY